jgi:hypothetical protein
MWTIEKFKEIYSHYETSGLPTKDFCMNEQITRSRFYYWQKKYRKLQNTNISSIKQNSRKSKIGSLKSNAQFIPLTIGTAHQVIGVAYPARKVCAKPESVSQSTSESFMEICYANGTRVSLSGEKDMELVKTLILLSR